MDQPAPRRNWLARVFLTLEKSRLRAGFRLLGQLFFLLLCTAIFGILLGVSWAFFPALRNEYALLASQVAGFLAIIASVYLARRWLDQRSFLSQGLSWNQRALRDIGVGFLIGGLMMGLIFIIEWAVGWLSIQGLAWQSESLAQVLGGPVSMLVVFTAGAWTEELLHRGYWLQNLEEGLNLFWAVIFSSLFFSVTHVTNPHFDIAALLGLFVSGVFLAYGYVRTRQLWLPIGLHIAWNLFESTIFGFSVSGLEGLPRLLSQTVSGPEIITGGAFGPEAGLVLLPALGLGAGLVYLYTRHRPSENT
jgi:membrane protease YdiL (CAAX protease family)